MIRRLVTALYITAIFILVSDISAQTDEARRHFDRGMAAVELAKTPEDLNVAINEFKQATILAPDWPDAHFNLGKVLETAARYNEAVTSYRRYLQAAPNAPDADTVRSLINRIEMKAEQVLTLPATMDVLVEFGKPQIWQYSATVRASGRECRRAWDELVLAREGNDTVRAIRSIQYYTGPTGTTTTFQNLKVTGPVLRYVTSINVCDTRSNQEFGDCTSVIENEVQVISKTLVRVTQQVIRGGAGAGTADGDTFACEFTKAGKVEAAPLDLALIVSNREKLAAALASGVNVNAKNQYGNTLLQQAVSDGYVDVVELLIANGADIKVRNSYGQTLLHIAASSGNLEIAKILVAKGAEINPLDNNGLQPLDNAVSARKKELAALLVSKGADLEARDKNGYTLLDRAYLWGGVELVIDLGANISARDRFGQTLLHRAAYDNKTDIAELLIAKGADINARSAQGGGTPLHSAVTANKIESLAVLLNRGAKVDLKDDDGFTPLHRAVAGHPYSNSRPIVELLISKGADINATNNAGYTPLQTSIEYCGGIKTCAKKEMFDLLIAKGADIEAGSSGRSALEIAMINNRKNMIAVLVAKGGNADSIDVNIKDQRGQTALHRAADWGDAEAATDLLSKGADVNSRDNDGWTPLHIAANSGSSVVAKLLLEKGADMNALDNRGATPLYWAMAAGATRPARAPKYMEVFSLLLENGANVNAGYKDGSTFLHDAVSNGNKEAVEILIKKGVELNSRNKNGKTPLQVAIAGNKTEIAELLKKNGAL